jgi:hypothetical protein
MISRLFSHVPPPEPIADRSGRIVRACPEARELS